LNTDGVRLFGKPSPRFSYFDQKKPVFGIGIRSRLLKAARRVALVIFQGSHLSA
jgi:hypothetical protein